MGKWSDLADAMIQTSGANAKTAKTAKTPLEDSFGSFDSFGTVPLTPKPAAHPFGVPAGDDPQAWQRWLEDRVSFRLALGYEKEEAERLAYREAVEAMAQRTSDIPEPGTCAGCGKEAGREVLRLADGLVAHDRPDFACLVLYGERREGTAVAALAALGVAESCLGVAAENSPTASARPSQGEIDHDAPEREAIQEIDGKLNDEDPFEIPDFLDRRLPAGPERR